MVQELMCNKLWFMNQKLRFKNYSLKGKYKIKGKDISLILFLKLYILK